MFCRASSHIGLISKEDLQEHSKLAESVHRVACQEPTGISSSSSGCSSRYIQERRESRECPARAAKKLRAGGGSIYIYICIYIYTSISAAANEAAAPCFISQKRLRSAESVARRRSPRISHRSSHPRRYMHSCCLTFLQTRALLL